MLCRWTRGRGSYIESIVISAESVVEQMPIDLRLDQDQVYEEDDKVMFDIFVCKALAAWALRQPDTLAQRTIIGFAVGCV